MPAWRVPAVLGEGLAVLGFAAANGKKEDQGRADSPTPNAPQVNSISRPLAGRDSRRRFGGTSTDTRAGALVVLEPARHRAGEGAATRSPSGSPRRAVSTVNRGFNAFWWIGRYAGDECGANLSSKGIKG